MANEPTLEDRLDAVDSLSLDEVLKEAQILSIELPCCRAKLSRVLAGIYEAENALRHTVAEVFHERQRRLASAENDRQGRPKPTVYFMQPAAGGAVKIGMSRDIHSRLEVLQRQSPDKLRVLATMPQNSAYTERLLHERFDHLRLHGEWFNGTEELLSFIRDHAVQWENDQ